jgi:Alginate export
MRGFPPAIWARRRWLVAGAVALRALLFYGVTPADGQASHAPTEVQRPALQIGSAARFNEDWSVLRGVDLGTTDDVWDRFKFVPLTPDASMWLSLGGQVRERAEYFRHSLFGASEPKDTDAYLLSRFRLNADLHVTRYFRVFAEGKSSFALDRELQGGRTTAYVDELELFNGFADIIIPFGDQASVTLRGGRQELILGSQRLVGPGDFSQVPKTFDGAAGYVRVADWTVIPLWSMAVPIVHKYRFNESTIDRQLYGIFGSGSLRPVFEDLDVYWLGVDNAAATFNGTAGRERRHTLGSRAKGSIGRTSLDFEVEAAGQFGSLGREAIAAGMFTAVLGYTLPPSWLAPRVYVALDYASGDRRRGGTVNTFNQLYPDAHAFLGYIDYIGRQNIVSGNGGVSVHAIRNLTLSVQQYFYWRASDRDAVYNKVGDILRPGNGTTARYVGAETDVLATYNVTRHLLVYGGYGHFFAGEFIEKTGPHKDTDFLYAAIQYTF